MTLIGVLLARLIGHSPPYGLAPPSPPCQGGGLLHSVAVVAMLTVTLVVGALGASTIKDDQQVIFLPTSAYLDEDGKHWTVPVHARGSH